MPEQEIGIPATIPATIEVPVVAPLTSLPVPPRTTLQEDLTTAGQRKINLIWEYTQAAIAILVVFISLIAAVVAMWKGKEVSAFLSFVCGNIIGFYFSRTNHAAIGGIGHKDLQEYKGR